MRSGWLAALLALVGPGLASADGEECRILDVDLQPVSGGNRFAPQIVAWLEDASGTFVDTVYITQTTGTFGLGNRPGRFDFNSAPLWPYGRRITTFPVWSAKQPLRWPSIEFQDGKDSNLSHAADQSTRDPHFCRPLLSTEFDAITCPTAEADTDKGVLTGTDTSRYPPREDAVRGGSDDASVDMLAMLNPFDAISQPTPILDAPARLSLALPAVPAGDYVLAVEVSREFDVNASYNESNFPPPDVAFGTYGRPYRGQPSVVYRVPFALSADVTEGRTLDYAGYGDPDGLDGNLRAPDGSISTGIPGSGADRLAILSADGQTFRIHVTSRREIDHVAPDHPRSLVASKLTGTTATVTFVAPGDDFRTGKVAGYEVRYRVGTPITEDNFETSPPVVTNLSVAAPKMSQEIELTGLLPETSYSIGIRALDNCRNASELSIVELTTTERQYAEVDACFIATAAYGSVMANDVERLRSFRDRILSRSAIGELAIETYYTLGPAIARFVGESELLRATARGALAPVVDRIR